MRTIREHLKRKLKRLGRQIGRLARAAVRPVRSVLKRVQGGVVVDRQRGEVDVFASPASARCLAGMAVRGWPEGEQGIRVYRDRCTTSAASQTPGLLAWICHIWPGQTWAMCICTQEALHLAGSGKRRRSAATSA